MLEFGVHRSGGHSWEECPQMILGGFRCLGGPMGWIWAVVLWEHHQLTLKACCPAPLPCLLFGKQWYWCFCFHLVFKLLEFTLSYPEPLPKPFTLPGMFSPNLLHCHPVNPNSAFKIQCNTQGSFSLFASFSAYCISQVPANMVSYILNCIISYLI